MYNTFFGFQARPFPAAPTSERYFPASSIQQARDALSHAIEGAQGPGLVIGAPGTGKSMLCAVLADHYRSTFRVAMLATNRLCTRRALLQNILFELGLPYRDMEEGELRLSLIDYLEPRPQCRHGMLMIVDEAHSLPPRLLEELRMITNLVRDGEPRVRLILAGSATFEERLASPRLESLSQRIAARCYLHPLGPEETASYVAHHIAGVGGRSEEIFDAAAMTAIYQASSGIPRLVNQVCDHALMLAAMGQKPTIGSAGIQEAWSDLQQLPVPWHEDQVSSDQDILEFGPLDDAADELDSPAAIPADETGQQMDELEMKIASIDEAMAIDEHPAEAPATSHDGTAEDSQSFVADSGARPEIELVFHPAHDPFSEEFEDEEVVVDPYNAFEQEATIVMPPALDDAATTIEIGMANDVELSASMGFDPASDPVMPEPAAISNPVQGQGPAPETAAPAPATSPAALGDDDRDMILVDEGEMTESESDEATGSHRVRHRYRQLFATLRQQ